MNTGPWALHPDIAQRQCAARVNVHVQGTLVLVQYHSYRDLFG